VTAAGHAEVWLLLYARGRSRGYRLLMAPGFLIGGADLGRVARLASQHRPEQATVLSTTGTLTDGRRVHVLSRPSLLTPEDLGTAGENDVLDEYGRPLEFTYGVLSLGGEPGVDDALWQRWRTQVVNVYREFLADEESFPLRSSLPYMIPATEPAAGAPRARVAPATTRKRWTLVAAVAVLSVICGAVSDAPPDAVAGEPSVAPPGPVAGEPSVAPPGPVAGEPSVADTCLMPPSRGVSGRPPP
jgi:hypothetical protein